MLRWRHPCILEAGQRGAEANEQLPASHLPDLIRKGNKVSFSHKVQCMGTARHEVLCYVTMKDERLSKPDIRGLLD